MSGFLDATYFVPNQVHTYMYQVYMPVIILTFYFKFTYTNFELARQWIKEQETNMYVLSDFVSLRPLIWGELGTWLSQCGCELGMQKLAWV